MIPIRDTIPSSRIPVVTYLLVAANLGLFFYEISLGENLPPFLERYAVVPARLLGAYFLLFPRARVVTLLPLFIFFTTVEIPAVVFLGLWFLLQFLSGTASLGRAAATGGVAWWAHVGGFVAGMVFLKVFSIRGRGRAGGGG